MDWTKKESEAINRLITAYGVVKGLSEESKEKVFSYAVLFHKTAFDIEEKAEPRGMIV